MKEFRVGSEVLVRLYVKRIIEDKNGTILQLKTKDQDDFMNSVKVKPEEVLDVYDESIARS